MPKYIFASFDQIDRKTDRQTDRHVQNNITSLLSKRETEVYNFVYIIKRSKIDS